MESTVVIKVKYGDTLRRFSARVINEAFDLNMDGLRGKIFSLFNFAPDSELTLTYVDEDDDVVTLVDDEDLHDVVKQGLDPVRITVSLNKDKSSKPSTRSSGSSTPLRSPRVQHPLQNLNSSVSEILKSIPEPLRESLSKISSDLASKATSSSPNLAEIVDSFSKLGLSYLNQLSDLQASAVSSNRAEASKDLDGSKVPIAPMETLLNAKSAESSSKMNDVLPKSKTEQSSTKNDEVNLNKMKGISASQTPGLEALVEAFGSNVTNLGQPSGNSLHGIDSKPISFQDAAPRKEEIKKQNVYNTDDVVGSTYLGSPPVTKDASKPNETLRDAAISSAFRNWAPSISQTKTSGGLGNSSGPQFFPPHLNECPFTGVPIGQERAIPQNGPREAPFGRSCSHTEGIFHRGVRCDGCGVHPITGPRFKSKVKEDYDLCSICFAEIGNDADYMRFDRPVVYRHSLSFKGLYDHHPRVRPPLLPHQFRGSGLRPSRPKLLDSRFIQDVNILDGTLMAPSTTFTKIWRMRNNGTIVWPQGCQLVCIGGDRLTSISSVELEISAAGVPVEQELDVAVEFVAPNLPGRYTSFWRMASPTGQKFGQRVWVMIQVDASMKEPLRETVHGFNLNWPPASDSAMSAEVENSNPEPMLEDNHSKPTNSNVLVETVPIVDAHINEHEANFPINNSLLVGGATLNPSPSVPSSSVSYPIIDLSDEAIIPAASTSVEHVPVVQHIPVVRESGEEGRKENKDVETTLLKELEDMGFKQVDLNKKVLRMNQYDLGKSVDDLCGVSEWDPLLEELEEMGFYDRDMNKKLLKKNNGSIKRVVMDLIAGEGYIV